MRSVAATPSLWLFAIACVRLLTRALSSVGLSFWLAICDSSIAAAVGSAAAAAVVAVTVGGGATTEGLPPEPL